MKILAAVSASSTDAVLASAIEVAQKDDAHICVLHVVDPTPCFIGMAHYDFGVIVDAVEAHGRAVVAHATRLLNDRPHHGKDLTATLPASGMTVGWAIASFAEEWGADLILLGAKKSGWWRLLSEDVAAEIRRRTDTPIQIVPTRTPTGAL